MIRTTGNVLHLEGEIFGDFLPASAALYSLIKKSGNIDIVIDLSLAEHLDARLMIPLVTIARTYRIDGINFEIRLPEAIKCRNMVLNSNWAHLILPEKFEATTYQSQIHLSALQYRDADQHYKAVDRSLDLIMASTRGLNRNKLKALEWALNEVTDNVLNHSESQIGGIFQVITDTRLKTISFYVCDTGVGIPRTLMKARPGINSEQAALLEAIREGVTSSPTTNQGNGLYGTYQCCKVSGGQFYLVSGNAALIHNKQGLKSTRTNIPFHGTFVHATIKYSYEELLEKALVFRGRSYDPGYDYVERIYQGDDDYFTFLMRKECESFGSREAGRVAGTKIRNLMDNFKDIIIFDFADVSIISSSFADEVFGKLCLELGEQKYLHLCKFRNMNSTIGQVIERAVALRNRK